MIEHTPGELSVAVNRDGFFVVPRQQPSVGDVVGNCYLIAIAHEAPHECPDDNCPGNVNRRKLEAFDELLDVCEYIEANLQPSVFDDEGDCRTWLVEFGVLARAGLQVAIAKAKETKQPPAAEAAEGLETRLAES